MKIDNMSNISQVKIKSIDVIIGYSKRKKEFDMFRWANDKCKPTKGTVHSACIDLCASKDVEIRQGETVLIGLGVVISEDELVDMFSQIDTEPHSFDMILDEVGLEGFKETHFLQLQLRSSMGKELIMPHGVGIIDLDYRDEIMIRVHNPIKIEGMIENPEDTRCQVEIDDCIVHIKEGDRIAQIMLLRHYTEMFGINTETKRDGGFGSTGVQENNNGIE